VVMERNGLGVVTYTYVQGTDLINKREHCRHHNVR
jgi:hypothetical protein